MLVPFTIFVHYRKIYGRVNEEVEDTFQRGPCFIKLTISEEGIARANGPAGTGIAQLAKESGVCFRLGVPGDYFPTTLDRCIAISGADEALVTFIWNVALRAKELMNTITIILPNSAISAIIGHRGNIIQHMQEATGARIKVENRMDNVVERVVRISSTSPEIVYKAFRMVLEKIQGDPQLRQNMHVNYAPVRPSDQPANSGRNAPLDPQAYQQYFQRYMAAMKSAGSYKSVVIVRPIGTKIGQRNKRKLSADETTTIDDD